jgi:hypothetical protein
MARCAIDTQFPAAISEAACASAWSHAIADNAGPASTHHTCPASAGTGGTAWKSTVWQACGDAIVAAAVEVGTMHCPMPPPEAPHWEPCTATVYENENFGGSSASFGIGAYDQPEFFEKMTNDAVSSVKVQGGQGDGCQAWLFKDFISSTNPVVVNVVQGDYATLPAGIPDNSISAIVVALRSNPECECFGCDSTPCPTCNTCGVKIAACDGGGGGGCYTNGPTGCKCSTNTFVSTSTIATAAPTPIPPMTMMGGLSIPLTGAIVTEVLPGHKHTGGPGPNVGAIAGGASAFVALVAAGIVVRARRQRALAASDAAKTGTTADDSAPAVSELANAI